MANLPAGAPDTLKTNKASISSKGMLTSVSVRAPGARRAPEAWPRQARRASSSLRASRTLHLAAQVEIISVGKIRLTLQPGVEVDEVGICPSSRSSRSADSSDNAFQSAPLTLHEPGHPTVGASQIGYQIRATPRPRSVRTRPFGLQTGSGDYGYGIGV